MQTEGLNIAGVTSDGCAFQVKALAWRDAESVQARGEQFSKLLFVPCICHRLQNAMLELFRENSHYRELIGQAREAEVFLRKPGARAAIGQTCPAHCATRWIYDYPLLRFLCNFYEEAADLLATTRLQLSPQIKLLIPLLEKIFHTMRVFEADDAPLACVVPEIEELLRHLKRNADRQSCADVATIYLDAMSILRRKCFSKTNSIFHLAFVLTPERRTLA